MSKRDLSDFPTLSTKERDRRWNLMRQMMCENDVECLLVISDPNPHQAYGTYFTNDVPGSTVMFPLEGEPTAIYPLGFTAGTWLESMERGEGCWVNDWRFQPPAPAVVDVIKEKGFANSRIGTIGVTRGAYFSPKGFVPYAMWTHLKEALPGVTFMELYDQFVVHWLTKSDEDLALFRHAAAIVESACGVMLEMVRPGVSEADINAAVHHEIQRYGSRAFMILQTGPANPGWAAPKWLFRAQKPRIIQAGDTVISEIFSYVGNIEAQGQMCIAVGDVPDIVRKGGTVAREAYEIGLQRLRPGVRFADVAEAMNEPLKREGAWHLSPLIHTINPHECVGPAPEGIENMTGLSEVFKHVHNLPMNSGDIVIREGMVFQLEPNACYGRNRVNIGGNVIVTASGCQELNDLPCKLRFVG